MAQVVCGVCATGYERVTSGECHTCMISTELHWGLLAGALAVALVGGWAFYRWKMRGLSAPTFTKTNTTVWTNYLKAREDYRPQAFLAIAVGHIQVFDCEELYFNSESVSYFLRHDRATRCFTPEGVKLFIIITLDRQSPQLPALFSVVPMIFRR
ncbi:hypothetical protein CYMTET_44035 [Cymbomonas tetramitiformis]|uniref:Uncharacterized protein n=1 Tax=Cymbomonas tetramitiformis TaxID=36881 RepID=A0AAE0EZQ4_9CHLO|nr:hypothetical protein CYMTET_44035 [Cymbomonas tetramitiformis]